MKRSAEQCIRRSLHLHQHQHDITIIDNAVRLQISSRRCFSARPPRVTSSAINRAAVLPTKAHVNANANAIQSIIRKSPSFIRRFSSGSSKPGKSDPTTTTTTSDQPLVLTPQSWKEELSFLGTQLFRFFAACGIAYTVTEYGIELTVCEGMSMIPTIRPAGEVVLMDRWTPRKYGLQGGCVGKERAKQARKLQLAHEEAVNQQKMVQSQIISAQKPAAESHDSVVSDQVANDNVKNDMDNDSLEEYSYRSTWHEPRIPANEFPVEGWWERLKKRQSTGISVGDVIVLRHPNRDGTLCKRVLGLPGDIITKPKTQRYKFAKRPGRGYHQGKSVGEVVPDGHIWVEGDNAWNSTDSRNYGAIPASLIAGRVLFRVWPLRGKALMERGDRPAHNSNSNDANGGSELPQLAFSGSLVLPAGYQGELIVRSHNEWEKVRRTLVASKQEDVPTEGAKS